MDMIIKKALESFEEQFPEDYKPPRIKIIGCGGVGSSIIDNLHKKRQKGAELIHFNTNINIQKFCCADKRYLIGEKTAKGLGLCVDWVEKGKKIAKESIPLFEKTVKGSDMVFVCAGMGGGTGTAIAPVIAKAAKEEGAVVISFVTYPHKKEGEKRFNNAHKGISELKKYSDTVVIIDLSKFSKNELYIKDAVELISSTIQGNIEGILRPSLVGLDSADVKAIFSKKEFATVGEYVSETRDTEEIAKKCLKNTFFDYNPKEVKGAFICMVGGSDLTLDEVSQIGMYVSKDLDDDADVVWAARIENNMKGKIKVNVVLVGVSFK